MNKLQTHFDKHANHYDSIVLKIVPYYKMMTETLLSFIPFTTEDSFHVLDLGCGTGRTSLALIERFPNIKITALDISENMLAIAKDRLKNKTNVEFFQVDFCKWQELAKYDGVVSSLALHHIESSEIKLKLFQSVYQSLKPKGFFINADVVKGSTDLWHEVYMEQWKKFMRKSVSKKEIEEHWIPRYYETDRPFSLGEEMSALTQSKFVKVDCFWKYFTVAVYGGQKNGEISS